MNKIEKIKIRRKEPFDIQDVIGRIEKHNNKKFRKMTDEERKQAQNKPFFNIYK